MNPSPSQKTVPKAKYNPDDWLWEVDGSAVPVSTLTQEQLQQALCETMHVIGRIRKRAEFVTNLLDEHRFH